MNSFLAISLLLVTTLCFGQNDPNQVKRLSKKEFKNLKQEKNRFIPPDLGRTKVLIVKTTSSDFEKLKRQANVAALYRNGYDTTSLGTNAAFTNYSGNDSKYYEVYSRTGFGMASDLKKKGIDSEVALEGSENNYPINDFRYLLKLNFVSTMRDPSRAYFTKLTYYFVDRVNNKRYEVLLPTNFDILDLIDNVK